jgi:hypothetical protein
MHLPALQQQASGSRFAREPRHPGMGRRYALEGDARPGDVLALAGGALVRDRNANGLIDGGDARVAELVDGRVARLPDGPDGRMARLPDVRDGRVAQMPDGPHGRVDLLAGIATGGARRGALVDVRG